MNCNDFEIGNCAHKTHNFKYLDLITDYNLKWKCYIKIQTTKFVMRLILYSSQTRSQIS